MSRLIVGWIFCFLAVLATNTFGAEPHAKIVYVGATWCGPCAGAKKFTIPALEHLGVEVQQLDFDHDSDKLPGDVNDVPTWFVVAADGRLLDTVVGHVHQYTILKKFPGWDGRHIVDRGVASQISNPPDIVGQLRRFLGTSKPRSHSSIAWQFEEPLDITLDPKTKITRPKQLFAEFDFQGDALVITFAEPYPQAHVVKAGATISVDITRVTLKGNVVTATADIAFGIQKDFEFTITKSPFDE